jgi:uncharacterized protein YcnI
MRQLMVATFLLAAAVPAAAHVGLAQREAAIGSTYRATLVLGHGCDGAATTRLRVEIPEGFYNVRPMPKPGWTVETTRGPYARPFDNHGTQMTEGVREITWSGGELPDSQFDEFVFRGTFGGDLATGARFHFPVVQTCGGSEAAWSDTSDAKGVEYPAPAVTLQPAKGHGH